jgi:hypothetical protein
MRQQQWLFFDSKRENNFTAENKKGGENFRASGFASAQGTILEA